MIEDGLCVVINVSFIMYHSSYAADWPTQCMCKHDYIPLIIKSGPVVSEYEFIFWCLLLTHSRIQKEKQKT